MILFRGTVKNGVVVLEPGTRQLPEGTHVFVEYTPEPDAQSKGESLKDLLLRFAGMAKGDYPPDFSLNHDHYIHGAPKRDESK